MNHQPDISPNKQRIPACDNGSSRYPLLRALSVWLGLAMLTPNDGLALPESGQVISGEASVSITAPGRMEIRQSSDRALIDWTNFNISAHEQVQFLQPSAGSLVVNRVLGNLPSEIAGALTANGNVILANPHGVIFQQGAAIDVGGLVATTGWIKQEDFEAGRLTFSTPGDGTVVNHGRLMIASGGSVVLSAPQVVNNGEIIAQVGRVTLASGHAFSLEFSDSPVKFAIPENSKMGQALSLINLGHIQADGGTVRFTSAAAQEARDSVVNLGGVVEARTVDFHNGQVILSAGGGVATVSGTVDVSGKGSGERGGKVDIEGDRVRLTGSASIDVSGDHGGGEVRIGGGFQGKDQGLRNASQTVIEPKARIHADAGQMGDGGQVIVWSDLVTWFAGSITARGGLLGGNGGFAEVSSKKGLTYQGSVDLSSSRGRAGRLLLDPFDLIIVAGGVNDLNGANNDDGNPQVYSFAENEDGTNASISPTAIANALALNHVELQATHDILINTPLPLNTVGHDLTLTANNNIYVNQNVTLSGGGFLKPQPGVALVLAANITSDTNLDLQTNVNAITLAGNSQLDVSSGTNAAISLAPVTGNFNLALIGDGGVGGSAISLRSVNSAALTVTGGTVSLNGDITLPSALDLQSNVNAITLAGNSMLNVSSGTDSAIKLAPVTETTAVGTARAYKLTLTGDEVSATDLVGSAISLKSVQAKGLEVTGGTVTLNGDITVTDFLDLQTHLSEIKVFNQNITDGVVIFVDFPATSTNQSGVSLANTTVLDGKFYVVSNNSNINFTTIKDNRSVQGGDFEKDAKANVFLLAGKMGETMDEIKYKADNDIVNGEIKKRSELDARKFYLDYLGVNNNSIYSIEEGGFVYGDLHVYNAYLSGSGGTLSGEIFRAHDKFKFNVNGKEAAQTLFTSPRPSVGGYTFNGFPVPGKGEPEAGNPDLDLGNVSSTRYAPVRIERTDWVVDTSENYSFYQDLDNLTKRVKSNKGDILKLGAGNELNDSFSMENKKIVGNDNIVLLIGVGEVDAEDYLLKNLGDGPKRAVDVMRRIRAQTGDYVMEIQKKSNNSSSDSVYNVSDRKSIIDFLVYLKNILGKNVDEQAMPKRTLTIYFAGHGIRHRGEGFWVVSDFDRKSKKSTGIITYQDLQEIFFEFEKSKIFKNVLIMVDSCYPGPSWYGDRIQFPDRFEHEQEGSAHMILTSMGPFEGFQGKDRVEYITKSNISPSASYYEAGSFFSAFMGASMQEAINENQGGRGRMVRKSESDEKSLVSVPRLHEIARERMRGVVRLKWGEVQSVEPRLRPWNHATDGQSGIVMISVGGDNN
ncbi:MAG: filamentous hemagglutinin N-terminal domain-containing protein [Magnetococcales bacterium]|nr:filamentous hemagglutinin N-terminal domain-containing protein [Magnetococcales bacterium]